MLCQRGRYSGPVRKIKCETLSLQALTGSFKFQIDQLLTGSVRAKTLAPRVKRNRGEYLIQFFGCIREKFAFTQAISPKVKSGLGICEACHY